METYSRVPFITHDRIDSNGVRAEVRVTTGVGKVKEIQPSNKGKSEKIIFEVDNTEFNPFGWLPIDDKLSKDIHRAFDEGLLVFFRIEQRRKDGIDRTLPFSEVVPKGDMKAGKDRAAKSLAAIKLEGDDEWKFSPLSVTRIEEDPVDVSHEDPYGVSLEEFTGKKNLNPEPPAAHENYSPKSSSFERPPFCDYNTDGSVNLGSYAVSVPINLLSFVYEYERTHEDLKLTEKQEIILTKALLVAANQLQVSAYEGKLKAPDLSAGSHIRARAIIFEVIRTFYPITNEVVASKESLLEWKDEVLAKGLGLWKWGVKEAEPFLR